MPAGSGKGYYYAAVTSDKQVLALPEPKRIDAAEVQSPTEAKPEPIGEKKGDYYYAHRRKIDFKVPTPQPRRLETPELV